MINHRGRKNHIAVLSLLYASLLPFFFQKVALSWSPPMSDPDGRSSMSRRNFATAGIAGSTALFTPFVLSSNIPPAQAASLSLAQKLSLRDPSALTNSVFNIPPSTQVYPPFMRGAWNVTLQYSGYIFPSKKIPRERLTTNAQVPGFQKCSIAALSDVGKEVVHYTLNIDESTGLEDRNTTLTTSINDHLGYPAVQEVKYTPKSNANRLSVVFVGYKTINAERIELFCNGREAELVPPQPIQSDDDNAARKGNIFVNSEYIRQVTFSGGSQVGIPRQVGTNYAHFWTWKEVPGNNKLMTGNLLTACYLDPQDAMFFEEPAKPVAVFSHVIKAEKL